MTESVEERLSRSLHALGEAKRAEVGTPEWDSPWLPETTGGGAVDRGGPEPAPVAGGWPRRRWVVGVVAAVAAVVLTLLLLPSANHRRNVDVRPSSGTTGVAGDVRAAPGTTLPGVVSEPGGSVRTSSTTAGPPAATSPKPATKSAAPATSPPRATVTVPGETPKTGSTTAVTYPLVSLDRVSGDTEYIGGLQPSAADCKVADLPAELRRPMVLPHIGVGDPCPVSTAYGRVSSWTAFGDGPVRVVGITATGTFTFVSYANNGAAFGNANPYWGGQKVSIITAPGAGAVLVRGYQLDGGAPVGFGAAPSNELQRAAVNASDWTGGPEDLRIQHPGCYGLQIDTPSGTSQIVFRAVGPALDPPPLAVGTSTRYAMAIHNFCLQSPYTGRIGYTPAVKNGDAYASRGDAVDDFSGLPASGFILVRYMNTTVTPPAVVQLAVGQFGGTHQYRGEGPSLIPPDAVVTEVRFYVGVPATKPENPDGAGALLGSAYPC